MRIRRFRLFERIFHNEGEDYSLEITFLWNKTGIDGKT